jgi:hypothetical protein
MRFTFAKGRFVSVTRSILGTRHDRTPLVRNGRESSLAYGTTVGSGLIVFANSQIVGTGIGGVNDGARIDILYEKGYLSRTDCL